MDDIYIGQMGLFKMDGDTYGGKVVSFDKEMIALCFVERIVEGGNVKHPNPILFVRRAEFLPVTGWRRRRKR